MSPLMIELIGSYASICVKIDRMTAEAQEGVKWDWKTRSLYNFLHQCKYLVLSAQIENGVF